MTVTPYNDTVPLWFHGRLFVISDSKIKGFEASTGSAGQEWPVPEGNVFSCIALPKHGKFIAYSTQHTIKFWDTQLGLIQHPQDIRSIALSPDDQFLAIGGWEGKITINSLSRTTVSTMSRWIVVYTYNFLAPIIFP